MTRRAAPLWPLAVALLLWSAHAQAHPVHASFAEVGYDAKTATLEVALEVDARDLEVALKARAGRPVDLDDAAAAEPLIAQYLRAAFVVRATGKATSAPFPLTWVGMEMAGANAVLYFTVGLGEGQTRVRVENRVFFELEARQVNTVALKLGQGRESFRFTRRRPRHQLKLR